MPTERPLAWRKYRCLVCRKVSTPHLTACPHCHATFPQNRVPYKIKYNRTITDAFVQAEHIETLKPAAFITLTVGFIVVLIANVFGPKGFVWLLLVPLGSCLISLVTIVRWIDRFTTREFEGEEFVAAFHKVRSAFWIWCAVLLAQVAGLLTLIRAR